MEASSRIFEVTPQLTKLIVLRSVFGIFAKINGEFRMRKLRFLLFAALAALCAISCDITKIDHTGPAKFVLKNISTGEEKTFESEELGYNSPLLTIRNNDSLQVKFVPELEFVKYGFDVTFTLFDGAVVKDSEYPYLYKMKVTDVASGEYVFSCEAISNEADVKIYEKSKAAVVVE